MQQILLVYCVVMIQPQDQDYFCTYAFGGDIVLHGERSEWPGCWLAIFSAECAKP